MKPPEMSDSKWAEIQLAKTNEAVLLVFAWLCDQIKVREVGGNNHGAWVKRFLNACGLPEGFAWCAASLYWASVQVDAPAPKPSQAAGVSNWRDWAKTTGRHRTSPKRGYLCYKKSSGISHIGIVVRSFAGLTYSIEGNTSPGEQGSQQDGGGLYRRVRKASFWDGFISQDTEA
jgi:hypothetical protein